MPHPRLLLLSGLLLLGVLALLWQRSAGSGPAPPSPAAAQVKDILNRDQDLPVSERDARFAAWLAEQPNKQAVEAVTALGQLRDGEAAARLTAVIDPSGAPDSRDAVRRAAVAALTVAGRRDTHAPLIQQVFLTDESTQVRAAAVHLLGQWHVWDAMPDLIAALRDPSPEVRGRAGAAVQRIIDTDYHFRANDPPDKREVAIRRLEADWPGYYETHVAWMKIWRDRHP